MNENEGSMEFDMIGIDASIANAFRRILLSEVIDDFLRALNNLTVLHFTSRPVLMDNKHGQY